MASATNNRTYWPTVKACAAPIHFCSNRYFAAQLGFREEPARLAYSVLICAGRRHLLVVGAAASTLPTPEAPRRSASAQVLRHLPQSAPRGRLSTTCWSRTAIGADRIAAGMKDEGRKWKAAPTSHTRQRH